MDEAERWLRENDPEYATTSEAWRDLRGGRYEPPAEEEPSGLATDLNDEEEDE
jgi:hypothetical protein